MSCLHFKSRGKGREMSTKKWQISGIAFQRDSITETQLDKATVIRQALMVVLLQAG